MTMLRVYLLAVGGFSVVAGFGYLLRPIELAALAELSLPSPTAVLEVQGFYGGQLVAVGIAIILGLLDRRFVVPALFLAAVPVAGMAAGRLFGVLSGGGCPPTIAGLFAIEAVTATVGGVLLKRELVAAT
jgi:hypothetical protein